MKLSIKKQYFEDIKAGRKLVDFRDAHITFVNEETGEQLVKTVVHAKVMMNPGTHPDVLGDDFVICFTLLDE